ncbi:MAG: 30S ribosomal protein S3 [Chloroflexi bacterium]|nr:30S ribosomal protein S3 [Chloroflexota bacterium]
MGQKVHPVGFRLGVIKDWQGHWYADKQYTQLLHEDLQVRRHIMSRLADAGVSKVDIERSANQISVTIHAAKPGIVIGKSGVKVEELRRTLETMTSKKVRVTIQEIRQPELDAYLVARNVAEQLEKRVAFRRAIKQTLMRGMRSGAKGIKVQVSGRLGGAEMSRTEWDREGRVPLHTLRADIDYGLSEAHTTFGLIGVKVWIYKGEVIAGVKGAQPELGMPVRAARPPRAPAPAPGGAGTARPAREASPRAEAQAPAPGAPPAEGVEKGA